ncbi:hypothetical protein M5K25_022379 [Dendrobium thyrsiflorum]|uniref:Uncharacterized protein n=1 Tax=Dendrobium thyrsiflorum TaxID=117978 RepID=A0ABD0U639_DENTH
MRNTLGRQTGERTKMIFTDDLRSSRMILVDRPITEDDLMIVWTISVKFELIVQDEVGSSLTMLARIRVGKGVVLCLCRKVGRKSNSLPEEEGSLPLLKGWKEERFSAGGRVYKGFSALLWGQRRDTSEPSNDVDDQIIANETELQLEEVNLDVEENIKDVSSEDVVSSDGSESPSD